MIKTETREVRVLYCDVCNKEIKGNYYSIMLLDGTKIDFCSDKCKQIYKAPMQT